ncbi:hypothetical protein EAF04_007628 [Stromatinia cepivora]|nr:hypothetical protein EAF04_007628 [Stromatinia cepivora]
MQQGHLDRCKQLRQIKDWSHYDFKFKPDYMPQNFFAKFLSFLKPKSRSIQPTEDKLHLLTKLRTSSTAEKRKKIDNKSTLYVFPPEVRDQIFDLIFINYFANYPINQILYYQNRIICPHRKVDIPGNTGLSFKCLPAFEIAF